MTNLPAFVMKVLFSMVFMVNAFAQAEESKSTNNSLLSFYQAAQVYDARFNAAISRQEAEHEQLPLAQAQLLPHIQLAANAAYNWQKTHYEKNGPFVPPSGEQDFTSDSVGVRLTQSLYQKVHFEAYKQAKVSVRQADTRVMNAQQQLILEVSRSYFNVLLAQEGMKLAAAEKAANNKQYVRAKRGFEVGSAAITDVYEAQARFDLALSEEIDAHKRLQIARRSLAKFTGMTPQTLRVSQSEMLELLQPLTMVQWAERASGANLSVRLAKESLDIAKHEVERARGFAFPQLDLIASYNSANANDTAFNTGVESDKASVMLQASLPLYTGGAAMSGLKQKRALYRSAQLQLEAARRDAVFQTEEAYFAHESGGHRIKALRQALLSSETSLTAIQRGFELGLRTGIDLLDAQRQLYAAKQVLSKTRYEYLFDRLRLEASAGQLDVEDIQQIDRVLN